MKKKYFFIAIAIVAVAAISYWLTRNPKPKVAAPEQSSGPMTVNAVVVVPRAFSNTITLSGSIESNEQVQIRSEVSGIVRALTFREGSAVQKGQVLLRIDDSELQARLIQAQSSEQLAADNEKRARLLLQKEAISQQEYDVAHADYESAKAQTELIRAQIAKTTVRAPFSGKIGLRSISEGEYLTPSTVVANLLSINPIKVLFSVPEKYSAQIKVGQGLTFSVSGSEARYHAEIYAIEPGVDAATRTISIRAIADNPEERLFPGAFARIELPLDHTEDAVLVPTEAVIPVQNGKQVFLLKNGKAAATPVEAEDRTSTDVLITDGVAIGDTVLTSGIMSLADGMVVTIKVDESD
ncbi:efflux RND transporter periplasmic adaptor subunit [Parapedobacter sp. 10938]|uniref:efflux RND transporter periplasmic adaptor subunit n=1 Tax=Parapedobacter flavus TaxID=3110225 RepID=UPI002DB94D4D|nr:efflux RND transporter periplasmic adaptor subunit [Parapedobacter sp. 10938]MEC3878649.1 efflux RND transporter periplasmic adaptor subunit [Parapedobacter sp. 10938]